MDILLLLVVLLAIHWAFGLATAILFKIFFGRTSDNLPGVHLTLPIIGYATANLVWWLGTFTLRLTSKQTLLSGLCFILISVLALTKSATCKAGLSTFLPKTQDWPIVSVSIIVFTIAAWPYLIV